MDIINRWGRPVSVSEAVANTLSQGETGHEMRETFEAIGLLMDRLHDQGVLDDVDIKNFVRYPYRVE